MDGHHHILRRLHEAKAAQSIGQLGRAKALLEEALGSNDLPFQARMDLASIMMDLDGVVASLKSPPDKGS